MQTVNIYEAKTHLSRLVQEAASGEPFIIAKAGRPLVKVVPLDAPEGGQVRRLGFLRGQIAVSEAFDRMASTPDLQLPRLRDACGGHDEAPYPQGAAAGSGYERRRLKDCSETTGTSRRVDEHSEIRRRRRWTALRLSTLQLPYFGYAQVGLWRGLIGALQCPIRQSPRLDLP